MKTNIVEIKCQQVFTTSLVIAENCPTERKNKETGEFEEFKRTNKSIVDLVKRYQSDFEELGIIDFPSLLNPKGKPTEYVKLNEDQATYLFTLFANTQKVRKFKLTLVKEFRRALDEIGRLYANPPRKGLIQVKRDAHKIMMDELVESRSILGKETIGHNFMCENKLCNWIIIGKFTKAIERDLTNDEVILLEECRKRNAAYLMSGLSYEDRKKRLFEFAMRYRTKLLRHV
jgi:hypothetical protein